MALFCGTDVLLRDMRIDDVISNIGSEIIAINSKARVI